MELRHLQAFVAVADELHFGRAAQRLVISQSTLSELVGRLERELGAPLFARTTRRVALTAAGAELLGRARSILAEVGAAKDAVAQVVSGAAGTVRVGLTPPVAPVLAPHLEERFAAAAPGVRLELEQLWLPTLITSLERGAIDAALTCGLITAPPAIETRVLGREPLFVGLRPDHPLATSDVTLEDLRDQTLGRPRESLFPAWALVQRQTLAAAGVDPPSVELDDTDLAATRWYEQPDVDWILLLGSFASRHAGTVVRPLSAEHAVPYTVAWCAQPEPAAAVRRFLDLATSTVPAGWQPPA